MIGTRKSLEAAVKEARYCEQGDLYRRGARYFFSVEGDGFAELVWSDFRAVVEFMDDEWGDDDEGDPKGGVDWLEGKLTERGL